MKRSTIHPWPMLLPLGLALAACQSPADEAGAAAAPMALGGQPRYLRLEGQIDQSTAVLQLTSRPSPVDEAVEALEGYYYYRQYEEPIYLYGTLEPSGEAELLEFTGNPETPAYFRGRFEADGAFVGEWIRERQERSLAFQFRASYPEGSLRFEAVLMVDSITLNPELPESPRALFQVLWLAPLDGGEAKKSFLRDAIQRGIVGDSIAGLKLGRERAFALARDEFFAQYREDAADFDPEGELPPLIFNYEQSVYTRVLYNEGDLLTLGFFNYWYSGGAHGMYGTDVRCYDLARGRRLELSDVLSPGYGRALGPALERAARRQFGLGPNEPLDTVLFDNYIEPNENFGLTSKGIFFTYAPYEVAAYALGEVQLFIPFTEIQDVLAPAFQARWIQ